jgi:uncharacterized protein YoxC
MKIIPYVLLGVIILIAFLHIRSLSKDSREARRTIMELRNQLAEKDTLTEILLEDNTILTQRLAFQQESLNEILSENRSLKNYLDENNARIRSLVTTVSELRLENQELKGVLEQDDEGVEYAVFDTTTQWYQLNAEARFIPHPTLSLRHLKVFNESTIGIYEQTDGVVRGFIHNTNPYLSQREIDFYLEWDADLYTPPINWRHVGYGAAGGGFFTLLLLILLPS